MLDLAKLDEGKMKIERIKLDRIIGMEEKENMVELADMTHDAVKYNEKDIEGLISYWYE